MRSPRYFVDKYKKLRQEKQIFRYYFLCRTGRLSAFIRAIIRKKTRAHEFHSIVIMNGIFSNSLTWYTTNHELKLDFPEVHHFVKSRSEILREHVLISENNSCRIRGV